MPANLQLLEVAQAANHPGFVFGPTEHRQEESCQNSNDRNDHQQFDQRESCGSAQGSSGIRPKKKTAAQMGQVEVQFHATISQVCNLN